MMSQQWLSKSYQKNPSHGREIHLGLPGEERERDDENDANAERHQLLFQFFLIFNIFYIWILFCHCDIQFI